jgi:TonB family protein
MIVAAIAIQVKIEQLRPQVVPRLSSHDVIYYTGDELPRTEDLGGANEGKTGSAGGDESFHPSQTIKVARGAMLIPKVVDAPNLALPSSSDAVANLLAVHPNPGPPPAEGLRSARSSPSLAATVVAPAPDVIRDYTRNGVELNSVIAPAPAVARDRSLSAPTLNPALISPAPQVASSHTLVAPALAPAVISPSPNVARDRALTAPSLTSRVIAPAPSVSRDQVRSRPGLAASVIPPAPESVARQMTAAPLQAMNPAVIPPPVSAPENTRARTSKATLPAPSVVAPPPSTDLSRDLRRLTATGDADAGRNVVPPPPSQSGSGSFMSSVIGKIFGPSEVVPPPPSASSAGSNGGRSASLAANVVAPPPSLNVNAAGGNPQGVRNGTGAPLGGDVVAPPPSVGAPSGTGSASRWSAPQMGSPNVVPPPPSLSGAGGGTGTTPGGKGVDGGRLLANNVVPPPPSMGTGGSNGSGSGHRGSGPGGPMDVGAPSAAAHTGGAGANAGAVISTQPGTKVGVPTNGGTGSLAMSPSGGEKPGLGGSGGGSAILRGNASGSGLSGNGAGGANAGTGHGSDPLARGGISPSNGPGGAGNTPAGNPAVRGVEISGGSNIVTLPGFGSDPSTNDPNTKYRSGGNRQPQTLNVVIAATAGSGGAFEPYKNLLKGEQYTTYLDTAAGTVVMEFADQAAAAHSFRSAISAPVAIRTDLPDGTPRARMVLACIVDASGNIGNVRVLESGPANMTAKVLSALRSWKFQPAMRNDQPVGVTAILGFGVNTDDRF